MNSIINPQITAKKEQWLQRFTRFGFASNGIVYCLMGVLTVLAALGLNSQKGDKTQAFKFVYEQPFGKFLLIAIAVGLCGYVMLRVLQAFLDTGGEGKSAKGLVNRVGYAISAMLYLSLIIYAIKLASGNAGSGNSQKFVVAKVMEYPMGEWIIGIVALISIGAGLNQIYLGFSKKFMKKVNLYKSGYYDMFQRAGMIGVASRGLVFSIVGYFLLRAALDSNPAEAEGTAEAFDFLQNNFGNVLMCLVAMGLVAYGIFMFIRARHERISFSL
jgi:hypothetical protein